MKTIKHPYPEPRAEQRPLAILVERGKSDVTDGRGDVLTARDLDYHRESSQEEAAVFRVNTGSHPIGILDPLQGIYGLTIMRKMV
ncbi:hypothetical protein BTJ68_14274 [Hortaea werneckii EXF-2000]|uniref:Uncharacterized protein n=1 Tax=Hortaea werneckii EXF-2000 TaxID=1157616 RepID=A0A1Z5SQ34_HORWE|nr:hypothetical protein BTJ68_14274 [Hortaea werneckii EXF-2000]